MKNRDSRMASPRMWYVRIQHVVTRSHSAPLRKPISKMGQAVFVVTMLATAVVAVSSLAAGHDDTDALREKARSLFQPLPKDAGTADHPVTPERVRLGRMLFFDTRMSADGTVSCSRCHQPSLAGTDALPKSIAIHDLRLPRNAQTVLNAALHSAQHWDGRFATVEEQAKAALTGPGFGNSGFAEVMARIKAIPGYAPLFRDAFPDETEPISATSCAEAIGAYERTLISPSRFDDFLAGKADALSAAERKGLQTFLDTGCVECHGGRGVGGKGFRKFGMFDDYRTQTGSPPDDKGRFGVTKKADDIDKFKVPGLRGVAITPPYFHDGSVNSLPKAVRIMAKVQLDADLSDADIDAIVNFLTSLNGPIPDSFERPPLLPAGGFVNAQPQKTQ
jgi:cytochrome c peroxidase